MILGALEAGGTKMVLAVGNEDGSILEREEIKTTTPEETLPLLAEWFKERNIEALGIGCFGPVGVDPEADNYGYILDTPKESWKNCNILGYFKDYLNIPVKIDTDVNGSCLGEITYGAAKGVKNVVYLTIGTGIGAGIAVDGKLLHGMLHPEAGHMMMSKIGCDRGKCICPYHSSCFEGLASGPSIKARYKKEPYELADNDFVWELESYYIAVGLVNLMMTVSPQKIILGGGVMHQESLFPKIRKKFKELVNGYIKTPEMEDLDNFIVPNSLDDNQGILGAFVLAKQATRPLY